MSCGCDRPRWMYPALKIGCKRRLEEDDVWKIKKGLQANGQLETFLEQWNRNMARPLDERRSLWWILFHLHRGPFLFANALKLASEVCGLMSPMFLKWFIEFSQSPAPLPVGLAFVMGWFAIAFFGGVFFHQGNYLLHQIGIKVPNHRNSQRCETVMRCNVM